MVWRILFGGGVIVSLCAAEVPSPNVIYILADDLGYGDLSCYGQTHFKTPNIDALASQGMLFTQHYSGSTVCAPSRCSLLTGMHMGHASVRGNAGYKQEGQQPMPVGTFTIAHLLKEAGYRTGVFGKWGLGAPDTASEPLNMGFDRFYGYNCQRLAHHYYPYFLWNDRQREMLWNNFGLERGDYAPDLIHKQVIRFVEESKDKPFFCYYALVQPHAEMFAPEEYMAKYRGKFLPESSFEGTDSGPDFRKFAYGSIHSKRIYWMALEYARKKGPLEQDPELLKDIHQALGNWFEKGYCPGTQWVDAVFKVPRSLYWTALLLGADLDSKYIPLIGTYAKYDPEEKVGQNRIWVCSYQMYWAAFTKNTEMMSRLSRLVQGELTVQPRGEDGLQSDFSWLQHGPQLYSGGYGLPVIIEVGRVAQTLAGTPCEFSPETIRMLSGYVLNGQRWILWRNRIDYSTRGRAIVRTDDPDATPPDMRSQFFQVASPIMMDADADNRPQYETILREMDSKQGDPSALTGNRYYPCSDYMVHRGVDWFASVRMVSTRTHGDEQGHSEGFKNDYLADGGSFLYRSGQEYLNIFPVWDWRKVPGVTCENSDAPIPYIGFDDREQRRGGSPFAGGVSDGLNGACAMILEKDGVSAHKSWFFLDDGYVCLGAGIHGPDGMHLSTAVNQCLASGEAVFSDETEIHVIKGLVQTAKPCAVYHDGVGYIFPEAQSVNVRAGTQSGYQESVRFNARDGDWRNVDFSKCKQIIKPVFSLYLSHDPDKPSSSYSYYVEPSVSKTAALEALTDFPAEILSNTPQIQAVQQKSDGLVQAVFYAPGEVNVPGLGPLVADSPCLVMLRLGDDRGVRVWVADPAQSSIGSVKLTMDGITRRVALATGSLAGCVEEIMIEIPKQ